jgi:hypothetical protein
LCEEGHQQNPEKEKKDEKQNDKKVLLHICISVLLSKKSQPNYRGGKLKAESWVAKKVPSKSLACLGIPTPDHYRYHSANTKS